MTPDSLQMSLTVEFDDNSLLPQLFGSHNVHLARIEQTLDISLSSRGNSITIFGDNHLITAAADVLKGLYARLKDGHNMEAADVDAALRMIIAGERGKAVIMNPEAHAVRTRKRQILPRSSQQAVYVDAVDQSDLVFGLGPAGTGKTYLAVAKAVENLIKGEIDRIILSRPAVEAGEQLGFLPGDMRDKVDPYLRPLYDALHDMLPANEVAKKMERLKLHRSHSCVGGRLPTHLSFWTKRKIQRPSK